MKYCLISNNFNINLNDFQHFTKKTDFYCTSGIIKTLNFPIYGKFFRSSDQTKNK